MRLLYFFPVLALSLVLATNVRAQPTCPVSLPGVGGTADASYAHAGAVVVPVFFHVITGANGAGAVTNAQIAAQVAVLNAAYAQDASPFLFVLVGVSRVQNNSWFTGIWLNSTQGVAYEQSAKQTLAQDPAHVLNIYTVDTPGDSWGFARYPFPAWYAVLGNVNWAEDSYWHGVVIDYDALPGGNLPGRNLGDGLVHEVGHYLGLLHTFERNECETSFTCGGIGVSDELCDTPPQAGELRSCGGITDACNLLNPPREDNYMDYVPDDCMTDFTLDQIDRMDRMTGKYRPSFGSSPMPAPQRVSAGVSVTLEPGTTFRYSPGQGLTVMGSLNASGVTFTATSPASGWDGITNYSGGSTTLAAGTVVERVGGALYGSGAVRVFGGTLTMDNARIENPASSGLLYGLKVSGASAVVRNNSQILGYSLGGILASNLAFVNVWNSIVRSDGEGLRANDADIWVSNALVEQNGTWGASADATGFISFLGQIFGQPAILPGEENTIFTGNTTGDLTASNAGFTGGSSTGIRRNSFTSLGTQARIQDGSSAVLEMNWWGQATGPDPARVIVSGKSTFDFCPWITTPGGSTPGGGSCGEASEGRSATGGGALERGAEDGLDVLAPALDALSIADALGVFAAVSAVLDSGGDADSSVVARSLPLVAAGLRIDALPEGYALLDRLATAGAGARGMSGHSRSRGARMQALAAFQADRAAGLAAAQTLTADPVMAPAGYGVLALAALSEGDVESALAAAEAAGRALDERHPPDDVAFVAAVRADVNAALPGVLHVADEVGERLPEEAAAADDGRLALGEPRPNPTTGTTTLDLALARASTVDAGVFDMIGRRVATLAEGVHEAGRHGLAFDAGRLPSGVYVVRVVVRSSGYANTLVRRVTVAR